MAAPTRHFDVGLIDPPPIATRCRHERAACEQRREALHPAEGGDVLDRDAPLGQQLVNVAVDSA
jgi:hypothetical protein